MIQSLAILVQQDGSQASGALGAGLGIGFTLLWLAIVVIMVAAMWKVFQKAGEPGWAAIVPIYNLIVLLKIAGKPMWWFLLLLIPVVNFIVLILVVMAIAKNFGKGTGFAFGLLLLAPVFYPMLAWGDAQYNPQP
jgi:uncharacterized membrane protein YhaH (DUF805 family)